MPNLIQNLLHNNAGAVQLEYWLIAAVIGGSFTASAAQFSRMIAESTSVNEQMIEACATGAVRFIF